MTTGSSIQAMIFTATLPFAHFSFTDIDAEYPLESPGARGWLSDALSCGNCAQCPAQG